MAGMLKRLKNVLSAEAHDFLDNHEAPDRIARQLVRETTDKVEQAQKLTIDAVTSEKQLAHQLKDHTDNLQKAQQSAELAIKTGDEVGARRAIENKLHHKKLVDTLTPQLQRAESNSASLKQQLSSLQKKLNSLKSEKIAIEARYKGAKASGKIEGMSANLDISDDTQSRLDQANSIVTAMEARNEAASEVAQASNPCYLEPDHDVDLEMQQLRDQLSK